MGGVAEIFGSIWRYDSATIEMNSGTELGGKDIGKLEDITETPGPGTDEMDQDIAISKGAAMEEVSTIL